MTNDIATQQQLTPNFDWLDGGSSADRPPFLKYRQGSWYCRPLTNDQDLDITGSLFAAAMPTFRQTRVAWTDESSTPVEEHAAYLALGQRLPTTYTDYPIRANGQDAWSDGFQIDGMLYVSGEWHQATLTTQTVTSNIQIRQAMQLVRKTAGRTYSLGDWTPVFELGKPEQIKSKAGGNIKVPNFVSVASSTRPVTPEQLATVRMSCPVQRPGWWGVSQRTRTRRHRLCCRKSRRNQHGPWATTRRRCWRRVLRCRSRPVAVASATT